MEPEGLACKDQVLKQKNLEAINSFDMAKHTGKKNHSSYSVEDGLEERDPGDRGQLRDHYIIPIMMATTKKKKKNRK